MLWNLEDHMEGDRGYMRIMKQGLRVADVFPFAGGTKNDAVIQAAREIVDVMNRNDPGRPDDGI